MNVSGSVKFIAIQSTRLKTTSKINVCKSEVWAYKEFLTFSQSCFILSYSDIVNIYAYMLVVMEIENTVAVHNIGIKIRCLSINPTCTESTKTMQLIRTDEHDNIWESKPRQTC